MNLVFINHNEHIYVSNQVKIDEKKYIKLELNLLSSHSTIYAFITSQSFNFFSLHPTVTISFWPYSYTPTIPFGLLKWEHLFSALKLPLTLLISRSNMFTAPFLKPRSILFSSKSISLKDETASSSKLKLKASLLSLTSRTARFDGNPPT